MAQDYVQEAIRQMRTPKVQRSGGKSVQARIDALHPEVRRTFMASGGAAYGGNTVAGRLASAERASKDSFRRQGLPESGLTNVGRSGAKRGTPEYERTGPYPANRVGLTEAQLQEAGPENAQKRQAYFADYPGVNAGRAEALMRPRSLFGTPAATPRRAGDLSVPPEGKTAGDIGLTTDYQGRTMYHQPIDAGMIPNPTYRGALQHVQILGPGTVRVTSDQVPDLDQNGRPTGGWVTGGSEVRNVGDAHSWVQRHPGFVGNKEYLAQYSTAAKAGQQFMAERGGQPFIHSRGPEQFLRRDGVDIPVSELTSEERFKHGVPTTYDKFSRGLKIAQRAYGFDRPELGAYAGRMGGGEPTGAPADIGAQGAQVAAGIGGAPTPETPIMPHRGASFAPGVADIPKPAGIDALVPPPEMSVARGGGMPMRGASFDPRLMPQPEPRVGAGTPPPTDIGIPFRGSVAGTGAGGPYREPQYGTVRMAGETGPVNPAPVENFAPAGPETYRFAPTVSPNLRTGVPGVAVGGGSTPAGVSNRQAADIETPTNKNAIARTETSPELDINKTDQTTAAFLGGRSPRRAVAPPPPPPPPPPDDQLLPYLRR